MHANAICKTMADSISPHRRQYSLATDEQTNRQTNKQKNTVITQSRPRLVAETDKE